MSRLVCNKSFVYGTKKVNHKLLHVQWFVDAAHQVASDGWRDLVPRSHKQANISFFLHATIPWPAHVTGPEIAGEPRKKCWRWKECGPKVDNPRLFYKSVPLARATVGKKGIVYEWLARAGIGPNMLQKLENDSFLINVPGISCGLVLGPAQED